MEVSSLPVFVTVVDLLASNGVEDNISSTLICSAAVIACNDADNELLLLQIFSAVSNLVYGYNVNN